MAFLMILLLIVFGWLLLIVFGWLLGGGAWDMVRHWFRHRHDTYEAVLLKDGRQARVVHAGNPASCCEATVTKTSRQFEKARRDAKALRELAEFELWFNSPAVPISGEDFMRGGHPLNCQCQTCVENRECF